jgi:hypothetical protein
MRQIDANRQMHETSDPHLLRVAQHCYHHLLKRAEHPLGPRAGA